MIARGNSTSVPVGNCPSGADISPRVALPALHGVLIQDLMLRFMTEDMLYAQ